ncbi:MAG TPA: peptidase M16 [Rhodospirillaceae bacterium]|nr:MAG: peptidase M16 [Alphaproteobacteria bacterium GWF2_58_20]HAU28532.1 peptidase M16 [Rhodospirillaceae bacterium]
MENRDINITTLANGMRVVTDRTPWVETASVGIWVGAGARDEEKGASGIAHFLEHMAFKGTTTRSARDIAHEIEAVGGHLNAYTSRESTAYYARILKEHVPLAMDILSDILRNSTFAEEELAKERTVVLQEIGMTEDTPDDIVFDLFQETAYPDQRLGRPVLGTTESVSRLTRDDLTGFIRQHYHPGRMVVSATGNLRHEDICALAEKHFGDLPAGDPVPAHEPACYKGGDLRQVRDLEQVHVVLGFRGISAHDPDYYAMAVFGTLLGGGMSSRLFQEMREKRGLVYSIHSFSASFRDDGLFGIYAGCTPSHVPEVLPVICAELVAVSSQVTDAEIASAKAQIKAAFLMALESTSSRCEQLGQQMLVFGRPVPLTETLARIDAVDKDKIHALVARLLQSTPTLTAIGDVSHLEAYENVRKQLAL